MPAALPGTNTEVVPRSENYGMQLSGMFHSAHTLNSLRARMLSKAKLKMVVFNTMQNTPWCTAVVALLSQWR